MDGLSLGQHSILMSILVCWVGCSHRFGAVAANEAMLLLPGVIPALQRLPPSVNTAFGSLMYSGWRALLMPIDTSKTIMQVDGNAGTSYILSQVSTKMATMGLVSDSC